MLTFIPDYQDVPCGPQPIWRHVNDMLYNAVYLHGQLQDIAGFDIVYMLEGTTNNIIDLPMSDAGILPVRVITHKGKRKEHVGQLIWWINESYNKKIMRGLIVSPEDSEACRFALKLQTKKSEIV